MFFDELNDWGVATLERAIEGLKCETAVHICYGYGIKANTDWKKTLGSEWRQYEEAFPKLQKSRIDMISLECQNSHVPMDLIELIRGKKVMLGAIDVASNTVETPEEVASTLRKALPNTRLQMLLRGQNLLGYRHYSDDVVRAFVAKAAENGIDVFRIFDAMNDVRNLKVAIEAVKAAGKHAQGTIALYHQPGAYG